ncbi:MAG: efflux RND transporter permease subunit, partial [Microcystaceae cyanobacterium]
MSFSPSLSVILLQPPRETRGPLGLLFAGFNRGFNWVKSGYVKIVEFLIRVRWMTMAVFAASLVATAWIYQLTPQGFVPEEDQGYFFVITIAPPGVSLNYTTDVAAQITQEVLKYEEVEGIMALPGFGFSGNSSNTAITFVNLKPWEERPGAIHSVFALTQRLNKWLQANVTGAQSFAANAPPVDGFSNFGGFEFQLQNRAALPTDVLIATARKFIAAANKRPELQGVFTQFTFDAPIISISVDRNQAKAKNVDIQQIFNVLQTYLGSNYVNQFVFNGRLYRVLAQAEGEFRSNPEDIGRFYVRSNDGNIVQLSSLVNIKSSTAPPILTHYNVYPAINIQGNPAPGYSSGQALQAMEEVAAEVLPQGFGYEWTGTAREEKSAGGAAPILFGLAFVIAFLVLAAQYESYVDPLIIMITVPLAVLGALGAILLRANLLQAGSVWP